MTPCRLTFIGRTIGVAASVTLVSSCHFKAEVAQTSIRPLRISFLFQISISFMTHVGILPEDFADIRPLNQSPYAQVCVSFGSLPMLTRKGSSYTRECFCQVLFWSILFTATREKRFHLVIVHLAPVLTAERVQPLVCTHARLWILLGPPVLGAPPNI